MIVVGVFRGKMLLQALLLVQLLGTVFANIGSANLPTVEYNAALGQVAVASSYYDYKTKPQFDHKYGPGTLKTLNHSLNTS